MVKNCTHCNLEYEAKTSRSNYCSKTCKDKCWFINNKDHKKQYYLDNLEQIRAREKSYVENGLSKLKNKRNYIAHSEKIKAEKRLYRKQNRNTINAYNRE